MSSPNASSRWPKCTSARASRAGAEEARRDTMPGGVCPPNGWQVPLLLWHASRLRLAGASARQLGSA